MVTCAGLPSLMPEKALISSLYLMNEMPWNTFRCWVMAAWVNRVSAPHSLHLQSGIGICVPFLKGSGSGTRDLWHYDQKFNFTFHSWINNFSFSDKDLIQHQRFWIWIRRSDWIRTNMEVFFKKNIFWYCIIRQFLNKVPNMDKICTNICTIVQICISFKL